MKLRKKLYFWGGIGLILLILSAVFSLSIGSAKLSLNEVWGILVKQIPLLGDFVENSWKASAEQIILKVRLPRIILALLVGASLSIAGAGFQGVLRNPLADPYTLGVASGASVGAAFVILFGLQTVLLGIWTIPIAAFLTGLISLLVVLRLANIQGQYNLETLILSGVVVSAFLSSFVSFMVSMSDKVINEIVFWMMGSLSLQGWEFIQILLPSFFIAFIALIAYSRSLNIFALGERQAAHLGLNVKRTRLLILIVSTFITAVAVSIVGTVGFVGLVVPHLIRLLVGPDYRILIPLSAIYGGVFVLWADTIARTLLSPTEIPLGVVTAFLGAPFFAYLLRKNKQTKVGGSL
ncbi:MAG: iron ABC transporter permease [Atopostipes suicloacalis]|nr:iron ABC transporter permease [Atopostipes suicloacalis]MDN6731202.1 iron ABC transporter permease [Atopostipes suicloacalis]